MRRSWLIVAGLALVVCFVAGIVITHQGRRELAPTTIPDPLGEAPSDSERDRSASPWRDPQVGSLDVPPRLPGFDLSAMVLDGDHYVVELPDGRRATLTLVPSIQTRMTEFFARYEVPHAAFVAIEPSTGRVLALVGHESADEPLGSPATKAFAPSASLFKMITAAALIEDKGVKATDVFCVPPGHSLSDSLITRKSSAEDTHCVDLGEAFGESNNVVFARLAYSKLDPATLRTWAARFGYDEWIPFTESVEQSRATIPDDQLAMAHVAAGFWDTFLSPMHAALITATIANGGVMMRPNMLDRLSNRDGELEYVFSPMPFKKVMEPETARQLGELMVRTTTIGTARKYLSRARLAELPDSFTPVGKTGTLSRKKPYLLYSWFAGLAPIERPELAMAVLVCNPMKWRIKAGHGAAEGLRAYLATRPASGIPSEGGAPAALLPDDPDPALEKLPPE